MILAGAILGVLGAGLALSGMMLEDSEDEEPADTDDDGQPPSPELSNDSTWSETAGPQADTPDLPDAQGGTLFTATEPREQGDETQVIEEFDPARDLLVFDLAALSDSAVTEQGTPTFPDPSTLAYQLEITPQENGDTSVTLALFDSQSIETEPLHYDVTLSGVSDLQSTCICVIDESVDQDGLLGGERVGHQLGSDGADLVAAAEGHSRIETGGGADDVTGVLVGATLETGHGDDRINVVAAGSVIDAGDGDDWITVEDGDSSTVLGGDGEDTIDVELGTDVSGGAGTDTITINVSEPPTHGVPLFLWNQDIEDARFTGHSSVTLEDDVDTVRLMLDPGIGGHLHQVSVSEESYGSSSSEVLTRSYTLLLWTPDEVTDIAARVTGSASDFESSLAHDSTAGSPEYEMAALDGRAPRVILTVHHGASFSGWFDGHTGEVSGGFDRSNDMTLVTNREIASLHDCVLR